LLSSEDHNKGQKVDDGHFGIIEIFNLCIRKNISIEEEWIPREQNQTADAYSKVFNYDDWSISDKFFDFFNKLWGPFTCDLLADTNNHKTNLLASV
jgi:hypothetical protein